MKLSIACDPYIVSYMHAHGYTRTMVCSIVLHGCILLLLMPAASRCGQTRRCMQPVQGTSLNTHTWLSGLCSPCCMTYVMFSTCMVPRGPLPLPIQPTVKPVEEFRRHLQTKYSMIHAPSTTQLKLMKVPGFTFFKPLIYEADEVVPDQDAVERLSQGQEPVADYSRIMQAASGGKVVLLEGPPGSGKRTVSRQLCRDWALCKLGMEFELVVLVPLRDLRKKAKVKLEDLLKLACETLPDGVVQNIEAVEGKGILFILDGYDEIKSRTKGSPTVVEKLLCRSYLPHASVIVTSRGIAAMGLPERQRIHKRFVIHGLSEDDIPSFVSYYFGGSNNSATAVRSVLDALEANPHLAAACTNTLALAIVCYLHSEQVSIPSTATQLYGMLLVSALKEPANQSPEPVEIPKFMLSYDGETFLRDLVSFVRSGSPLSDVREMAGLALAGILQDKFAFETDEEMVEQFLDGCDYYGLLDSSVAANDSRPGAKHNKLMFLHLTVQEFMAALHVATQTPEQQAAFWSTRLAVQYKGHSGASGKDRFMTMFKFFCGLTGLENGRLQEQLLHDVANLRAPDFQFSQSLVTVCSLAVESGNKEFACALLSPLGKKVKVDVGTQLDSADIAWCLTACKENVDELVVNCSGTCVHDVAYFLRQLDQLRTLSVLELPYMECSSELPDLQCSEGTCFAVVGGHGSHG